MNKIITDNTKEAQLKKEKLENKKNQTFLDYCRNEKIAFTNTDKLMYNLETTKDRHYILRNFLET